MSTPQHARLAEWDAAYVLGSLSPADRREFEDHLEDCERCRAAVAELSGMPGLLGRLDDARAFALLEDGEDGEMDAPAPAVSSDATEAPATSADLVASIRAHERRRRLRRTAIGVGALAAAAALASALTVAIPAALAPAPPMPDAVSSFESADGQAIPIDVLVHLTSTSWGTRLEMDCIYRPQTSADSYGPGEYSLWVVAADGTEQPLSTWTSTPGSEVVLEAGTATDLDDIAQLDLRSADGDLVLMTGEITPIAES
jgi:hypothetical protein